jgi:hypothetical protein
MWGHGVHEDDRCFCRGDRDENGDCERHRTEGEERSPDNPYTDWCCGVVVVER